MRTRILEATLEQVRWVGFAATSEQIAQQAQVGTGSLFRHFETMAQLLPAAFVYASDLLREPPLPADTPPERNLYVRCQQLWRQTAQQAVRQRAAFHYWCQYRAAPLGQTWEVLTQLQLGPFDQVPNLLLRARGHRPYNELDACLLASQWTTSIKFLLAHYTFGPGQTYDPTEGLTPGQLLDRTYEAWWEGLELLRETTVRP